ncbi:MAG: hypothetical protein HFG20_08945 [Anaerotruncus sp.]|nr:hypothetical protein [Anaerotruncus sp.]
MRYKRILILGMLGIMLSSGLPVAAADADYPTAQALVQAVEELPDDAQQEQVERLASALRKLSTREKKLLDQQTISRLGEFYNQYYSESVKVHSKDFLSRQKIPDKCISYGAAAAAGKGVVIELEQRKPSNSEVVLQFYATSNQRPAGPFVLQVALPDNVSTDWAYTIKGLDGKISTELVRVRKQNYVRFITRSLGSFQLLRETDEQAEADKAGEMTDFWKKVENAIEQTTSGNAIYVRTGSRTTMPTQILRTLQNSGVTLILRRGNGTTITIDPADIDNVPSSKDYYTMGALANMYH